MSRPVVSSTTPNGQIVGPDGKATFSFIKWMQSIGTTINSTFDTQGDYQGGIGDQATIVGRKTLASIVQNIDTDGVVGPNGIDFARNYINKDTDHIADGTGSPLAGGKVAFAALVASTPVAGQTIRFDGTGWLPVAIAESEPAAASKWLDSYDDATGTFTASQPAFANVNGILSPAQLPASATQAVIKAAAYLNSAQSYPAGAQAIVAVDTVLFDPSGVVDVVNHRIRPNVSGYYMVTGNVSNFIAAEIFCSVYKNGAEYARGTDATGLGMSVSCLVFLNGSTDYVQLSIFNRSVSSQNAQAGFSFINQLMVVGPF